MTATETDERGDECDEGKNEKGAPGIVGRWYRGHQMWKTPRRQDGNQWTRMK